VNILGSETWEVYFLAGTRRDSPIHIRNLFPSESGGFNAGKAQIASSEEVYG
jgi:hypothetical protein